MKRDDDVDREDDDGHLECVADEAKDGEDLDGTPKAAPVLLLWGGALGKGVIHQQVDYTHCVLHNHVADVDHVADLAGVADIIDVAEVAGFADVADVGDD